MWSRINIPHNKGINEKDDARWNIATKSVHTQYRYVSSSLYNEILVPQWHYLQKKRSEELYNLLKGLEGLHGV